MLARLIALILRRRRRPRPPVGFRYPDKQT